MSKYKVGDKVRVRSDLVVDETYGSNTFVCGMKAALGKKVTISTVFNDAYRVDEFDYTWTDEMFENTITQTKEEKEMGKYRTQGIVELWASKRKEVLRQESYAKKRLLENTDVKYAKLVAAVASINETCQTRQKCKEELTVDHIVRMLDLDLRKDILSDCIVDKLKALVEEYEKGVQAICDDVKPLGALLSACETYEQEMDILRTKGIVDEQYNIKP